MKALAEKGHDVTVVSHFPNKIPIANYKDEPLVGLQSLTNAVDLNVSNELIIKNILLSSTY